MTSDNSSPAGPRTGPTTPQEALELVRSRFGQPRNTDGSPAPLQVREFDLGYLVYATYPPRVTPVDANGRPLPAQPGGSSLVVAKDTGTVSTLPNYPPQQAIALYRKQQDRRKASEG
ncbi:hypothetical protein ACWGLP_14470 [Streptomyces lydicus]|uniref:hypothetical protein n=1 Tax=Streptomyces lydicus TaxID=47763 RepID=UPI0037D4C944